MRFSAWFIDSAAVVFTMDDGDRNRTVVVADIPAELDQEDLELYLANQRIGGGEIDDIQLDECSRTALVKFIAAEGMTTSIAQQYDTDIGSIMVSIMICAFRIWQAYWQW